MEKTIIIKENNIVYVNNYDDSIIRELKKGYMSPCFRCQNGYASKCEKIFDKSFKKIDEYDFVSDGLQVCDTIGNVEDFYVAKCNNFKEDEPRKKLSTKAELQSLKKLKESIKILYFGGIDIDEANQTQIDLIKRGQLTEEGITYDRKR